MLAFLISRAFILFSSLFWNMLVATCLVSAILRSFFCSWFYKYCILVCSLMAWLSICFLFWTSCERDMPFRTLLERTFVIWLPMLPFSMLARFARETLPRFVVEKLFLPTFSIIGALYSLSEPGSMDVILLVS